MAEDLTIAQLVMDRGEPLGNSKDVFLRRALHTKIGNSGAEAIPVTDTKGIIKTLYGEANAVAGGAVVSILSYTVPPLKKFDLLSLHIEGDNIADYHFTINGDHIGLYRTWWSDFGRAIQFHRKIANPGDLIRVFVSNWRSDVADFNATLIGDEYGTI